MNLLFENLQIKSRYTNYRDQPWLPKIILPRFIDFLQFCYAIKRIAEVQWTKQV